MEINQTTVQSLVECLTKTLSPERSIRQPAESFLESIEGNENFSVILLNVIDCDSIEFHVRVSAAVTFKNFVKRNWRIVEDVNKICDKDRNFVKTSIVNLMLKNPEQIQKQLSDAISVIGKEDFPMKWTDLLKEFSTKFLSQDIHIINGVLRTAHSLFKRYRHEFKSQELWTEIKYVLDNFAEPFTKLFIDMMNIANENASNPENLKIIFSSLVLICKVFYSLNYQDLPEHFEDNMNIWMGHFHTLLTIDNKILQTQDDEEAGLLEQVKSQICDNVALYAQKYDEEFSSHLPGFVDAIWNLLVGTGQQVKYDLLVSNAIQFLASVADRNSYRNVFEAPGTLQSICEKVIVPNMHFREADEEMFEDNPEEYIRRDIEGSDVDTRRRAACDLVRSLCRMFEGPVIENFSSYIQAMLQEYSVNPKGNWKSKDAAIYLVTSLAAKGATQRHGITQTSELVNIIDFMKTHVYPDIENPNVNENPVLKADAIKYVMVFRSQLRREALVSCIPGLIRLLTAETQVVHTYAAHALERIFTVKLEDGPAVTKETLSVFVEPLLTNLFALLETTKSAENEYVMKAIMRSFSLLQEKIAPYLSGLLQKLIEKLMQVAKWPKKPHFNHYIFETICVAIRAMCKADTAAVEVFEKGLMPSFQEILQQDVLEFIPYVFQILSLLLELHPAGGGVPDLYIALFPHLLQPVLWERSGNIPALVRLLQAFISVASSQIEGSKLEGLLGIFQKLVASKTNDHEGFYILNTLINTMSKERMEPFIQQIFVLCFRRLTSSKTTKFIKSFLIFMCVFTIKYGANVLIQTVESIQEKMFGMVLEKLFVPNVQKLTDTKEKKICAIGITNILTDAPIMLTNFQAFWGQLLQSLIGLFELPEDSSIPDDEHFIDIEDTPGYQAAYSKLAFSGKSEFDPCANVENPRIYLVKGLQKVSQANPGKLQPLITASLPPQATDFLQQYLNQAGVMLS
ncbi:DgyrCDS2694 [Dimorphilus gyrociliatus]|uniref:Exportin-2 n=1 Tax=Dimorphilus gyrociliatus TaxID=2664684 RepID=A0A7I8VCB3_9ANNE|nr:DgyrCDS2694 [Dimorphilus gyrociliatus]